MAAVIRSPAKLPPVAFNRIEPLLQRFGTRQEVLHTNEEPTIDSLAVTAALTRSGRTAEVHRRGVGSIRIEVRQHWLTILQPPLVARMTHADAGADVVPERCPLGPTRNERLNRIGSVDDCLWKQRTDPKSFG